MNIVLATRLRIEKELYVSILGTTRWQSEECLNELMPWSTLCMCNEWMSSNNGPRHTPWTLGDF